MSCFSFYLFSFLIYEIREQDSGEGAGGRGVTNGRGEVMGKGGRKVNMAHKMSTFCKCM
jgi:hypothetical protein